MDPVSTGIAVLNGLSSISGIFGASSARKRAEAARAAARARFAQSIDQEYQDTILSDSRSQMAAAGTGGDAISALYNRSVEQSGNSGVFNSTYDRAYKQGLLADQAQAISSLALRQKDAARGRYNDGMRQLAQMDMGAATDSIYSAQSQEAGARSNLASLVGALGQYQFARSGGQVRRNGLPTGRGGPGNPGAADPRKIGLGLSRIMLYG